MLETLRDATGETVIFGKLQDDGRVLYLEVRESQNPVRYTATPGELRDVHINSIGRAILGAMPEQARDAALAKASFQPRTARTVASREALEHEIAQWRQQAGIRISVNRSRTWGQLRCLSKSGALCMECRLPGRFTVWNRVWRRLSRHCLGRRARFEAERLFPQGRSSAIAPGRLCANLVLSKQHSHASFRERSG
ncbi:hypothetical protein AWV79_01725 [Cupriavidus sp. UYMMa02A]|nr:hypothetical protein AWV79_01725 [Cupriavidus sp. UYMMa02A]